MIYCLPRGLQCCMQYRVVITGLRVGVTKAPFINFSIRDLLGLARVPVRCFESHSYLTGVIVA